LTTDTTAPGISPFFKASGNFPSNQALTSSAVSGCSPDGGSRGGKLADDDGEPQADGDGNFHGVPQIVKVLKLAVRVMKAVCAL